MPQVVVPRWWRMVLSAVRDVARDALLAGGAPRDLIMGREVRDLDIFVPAATSLPDVGRALTHLGYTYAHSAPGSATEDIIDQRVYTHSTEKPVNVISALAAPEYRLRRHFDFGLCQAAFDGRRVITTRAFRIDASQEQFTLLQCHSLSLLTQSLVRYKKLRVKYPTFPLVLPADLPVDLQ